MNVCDSNCVIKAQFNITINEYLQKEEEENGTKM